MIKDINLTAGQQPAPVAAMSQVFPGPTTVGDSVFVYLRWTGPAPPNLGDLFGNAYLPIGSFSGTTASFGFWRAQLHAAGANHTVTATSNPGPPQILEMAILEQATIPHALGIKPCTNDYLARLCDLLEQTNAFEQRLCNAERA